MFIVIALYFAYLALIMYYAEKVSAETETEQEESTEIAEVVPGREIAPVQRGEEMKMTPEELAEEAYWDSMEMVAVCVEAEAGNQGLEGKRLVADVILNRMEDDSGIWGTTVEEVITQPGQFASYWDGGMDRVVEPSEETLRAVQMEIAERGYPEIYYFREGEWPEYGTPWRKVGDHYFSGK